MGRYLQSISIVFRESTKNKLINKFSCRNGVYTVINCDPKRYQFEGNDIPRNQVPSTILKSFGKLLKAPY